MYKRKCSRFIDRPKRKNKTTYCNSIGHIVYDEKDVSIILNNTPLSFVIGNYVVLKKKGGVYVGRCPFCKIFGTNDSHFRVSNKKKRYKCFYCGVSGKYATGFLKRYYNITFERAISHINYYYHKNKFELKVIKNITIGKKGRNIGEDLPF